MELNRRPRSQGFEALGNRFIIFFWNFGIVPATQTLFLCFHRLTKPTVFMPAVMTKPLFAQNVLGLTLVLCIHFILDFFPWLHLETFQNFEVRQFCLRLRVVRRSIEIILHMVIKLRRKKYLLDIPLFYKIYM